MRFYYENCMGDSGYFTLEKTEMPKAIMSAWNIDAALSIVMQPHNKLIFDPDEENECNNNWLKEFGLYIKDGRKFRELHYISDDGLVWEPDNYEGLLRLN